MVPRQQSHFDPTAFDAAVEALERDADAKFCARMAFAVTAWN